MHLQKILVLKIYYGYLGRGLHCWISDDEARNLTVAERKAIFDYITIENVKTIPNLGHHASLHPFLIRSYDILLPIFEKWILPDQKIFETEDSINYIMSLIETKERKNFNFLNDHVDDMDGIAKWELLKDKINKINKNNRYTSKSLKYLLHNIVYHYTWPRIDENVSYQLNHLLKGPFNVHKSTGKISVVIDPNEIDAYSPLQTPTLDLLYKELEALRNSDIDIKNEQLWKRTSLAPYISNFENFVKQLEQDQKLIKKI